MSQTDINIFTAAMLCFLIFLIKWQAWVSVYSGFVMKADMKNLNKLRQQLRKIQSRLITYGVVTDREEALLRKHTDYYDLPRKIVKTPPGEYNK